MKNKKVLIILAVIVAILVLGGVGAIFLVRKVVHKVETTVTSKMTEQVPQAPANTNVFESIKDAMGKSLSLQCNYNVGTSKTAVYIKGTNIRIEGSLDGKNTNVAIFKDNQLWSWNPETKEGMILPQTMTGANQAAGQGLDRDKFLADLEQQKQFCQVTVVADSQFVPPTDVKFTDLGKIFEKIPVASPAAP